MWRARLKLAQARPNQLASRPIVLGCINLYWPVSISIGLLACIALYHKPRGLNCVCSSLVDRIAQALWTELLKPRGQSCSSLVDRVAQASFSWTELLKPRSRGQSCSSLVDRVAQECLVDRVAQASWTELLKPRGQSCSSLVDRVAQASWTESSLVDRVKPRGQSCSSLVDELQGMHSPDWEVFEEGSE